MEDTKGFKNNGPESQKVCHCPTEIIPRLWLASRLQSTWLAEQRMDVLVPLEDLSPSIWDTGWRGQIYYVPIRDFGIPPCDVTIEAALTIIQLIERKKRVGIFCIGGHGRTGFLASIILGFMGVAENPIAYLREHYCRQAVESATQIREIARILNKPELENTRPKSSWISAIYEEFSTGSAQTVPSTMPAEADWMKEVCGSCFHFEESDRRCKRWGDKVHRKQKACVEWKKVGY